MRQASARRGIFLLLLVFWAGLEFFGFAGWPGFKTAAAESGPEAAADRWTGSPAKYVFLFIGDGMGPNQVRAAELYAEGGGGSGVRRLSFTQFEGQGRCATHPAREPVTDSAPAATALASGYKTDNGVINMDPSKQKRFFSIADSAKANGMKVGVVSSVSINQATPAAFYAFSPSRGNFYDIGKQLVESGVDYFGGGGFHRDTGRKKDRRSLYAMAAEKGVAVLRDRASILNRKPGGGRVFAVNPVLDSTSSMPYAIDKAAGGLSLAEFTRKGIELLDNPRGFFFHVEGGKLDWACHANDAATAIGEVLAFDEAIREALRFAERRPGETLIVVVGDHETGGMTLDGKAEPRALFETLAGQGESYPAFERKIAACRKAKQSFQEFLPVLTESFGLRDLSAQELQKLRQAFKLSMTPRKKRPKNKTYRRLYSVYEPLAVAALHILDGRAGIGWTTFYHTGVPVPIYARGAGAELFDGDCDNTDVAWKLFSIMGLESIEPVRVR